MRYAIAGLLIFFVSCSGAQDFKPELVGNHIKVLAADDMQGRGTGTEGEKKAAAYIEKVFTDLKLKPKGDEGQYRQQFPFNRGPHGTGEAGRSANIAGYLDNGATTTIIIGAHYDHLGTDGQGSSLDANPKDKIHNGADDNASGVAGVLELARYFGGNGRKESNNFLFILFSGEELGLIGSKYFTENSTVDLGKVNFMINLDMVGRLNDQSKTLQISGTGTSPFWEPALRKIETDLKIVTDSSGTGPSDHTSFYLKDLPVLHFFTGAHTDYHKPGDDIEKINLAGEVSVLKVIAQLIDKADKEPKLSFLKTKSRAQGTRTAFKVTLGIMPSYANEGQGLKVDGVSDGKPASKAGILTGDIILQMGDYPISDINAYMNALNKFEKGQTITVRVKRGSEEKTLQLTF